MKQGHHYYVYILECSDKSYYTGVTNNLERRLWEHETGFNVGCYTFKKRPVVLKYCIHLTDIKQAIAWEKQLKGWSRKKKEALFKEDWEEIKRLAKNYTEHPRNPSTSHPSTSHPSTSHPSTSHPSTGSG